MRIIKSEICPECKAYIKMLDQANFPYVLYDGDAEENEDQLDAWHIFDFPVVHIIDKDTGKLMHAFQKGSISIFALRMKMAEIKRRN